MSPPLTGCPARRATAMFSFVSFSAAHERQAEEVAEALGEGPESFYKSYLDS